MKIVQKFFLGLGMVLGVAMLAACGGSSTPGEVAKDFMTNAYQGNGDVLIKFIHIPDQEGTKEGVREMIDGKFKAQSARAKAMADEKGGLKSVEIVKEETNGDKAKVEVKVIFADDSTKNEYLDLTRIKDDWKVEIK